jgi:hypothetical protein
MGEVEFDGPTATRLKVDEQQSILRIEQVAWVRLTVQQLLRGAAIGDRSSAIAQCAGEKLPVRIGKRSTLRWARTLLRNETPN